MGLGRVGLQCSAKPESCRAADVVRVFLHVCLSVYLCACIVAALAALSHYEPKMDVFTRGFSLPFSWSLF